MKDVHYYGSSLQRCITGGFTKVYLTQTEDNMKFAIKVDNDLGDELLPSGNIIRELYFLNKLLHPNIITPLDVIQFTYYHIALVFPAALGSLNRIPSNIRNELDLDKITYQILCGVKYLHDCDIIHRDIKLDNILLASDFNILITDLGSSCYICDSSSMVTTTLAYRAPEQFENKIPGIELDIWSLGICMFELYSGRSLWKPRKVPEDIQYNTTLYLIKHPYKYIINPLKKRGYNNIAEFIVKMCRYVPETRISIDEIVTDPYFDMVRNIHGNLPNIYKHTTIPTPSIELIHLLDTFIEKYKVLETKAILERTLIYVTRCSELLTDERTDIVIGACLSISQQISDVYMKYEEIEDINHMRLKIIKHIGYGI